MIPAGQPVRWEAVHARSLAAAARIERLTARAGLALAFAAFVLLADPVCAGLAALDAGLVVLR